MSIYTRMLRQNAVYWPPGGNDEQGRPAPGEPELIKVRWEDRNDNFVDATGNLRTSRARVYTSKDVVLLGFLHLVPDPNIRTTVDLTTYMNSLPDDPSTVVNSFQIQGFGKEPNLRATKFLRFAML